MRVKVSILAGAFIAFAAPAAADCRAEIAETKQKAAIGDSKEQQPQGKKTEGGEGTAPVESWFGSSASKAAARDKLENARIMAEHGKEEGCLQLVQEVRRMMEDDPKKGEWSPPESAKAPSATAPSAEAGAGAKDAPPPDRKPPSGR